MIYKNAKVGKEKNVTLVELGSGDVSVAAGKSQDDTKKYTCVVFNNIEAGEIGRMAGPAGITTDESGAQVMIAFYDIKSIKVVEKSLKTARIYLRNMK